MKEVRIVVFRYGLTLAAVLVALAARWLLDPALGDHLPFVTFFVAVAAAAWLGGLRPALMATGLGLLLSWYVFVPTRFSFDVPATAHAVGLVMYMMVSLAFCGFGEAILRVKRKAQEGREQLRTTLACIGDAVISTDMAGHITTMNAVAESLTGWKSSEAIGQPLDTVFRVVNEKTRQPVDSPVTRALREGVITGLPHQALLIGKDGTERPVDDSAAPIRCKEGEVVGCVVLFRDIADRRTAERALRLSEARKAAVLESAIDALITMNHRGLIEDFNPAAERIFGYRHDQVLGRSVADTIIPPRLRQAHRDAMERYLRTGQHRVLGTLIEVQAMRADGSEFPCELSINTIRSGDGPPFFTAFARDISERQAAELEVRRARSYAEATLRTSPVPLLVLDGDLRIVTANEAFYQRFQVQAGHMEGRRIYELGNHQWDIPRLRQLLEDILPRHHTFEHIEVTHDFESIGRRTMLLNARRMDVEEGGPQRIILVLEDITARKRAEDAAIRARQYAEATLRTSPVPLLVLESDLRVVTANESFYSRFEVDPAETEGRLVYELGNGQWNIPRLRELLEEVLPEHSWFEGYVVTHDFEHIGTRTMVLNARRMEVVAGGPERIVLVIEDITERKRLEDLERASERRLRFVMDSMPQKIFTARPNGDVDYFNPTWTEFTGLSFEQIRDWGWTQFIHPNDVAENVRVWKHSIETGEMFHFEHRFRRADGEYRWHLSRALPMRDEAGRIVMWIGSNTDIHEQLQAANKLRQLAAELSETDRRKNEFLAMLAHELRNPLAPIRNAVQVMRLTGGTGEEVVTASEMMERQVAQLVRLVDDLLDVSRISRGTIELRKEWIDLASFVNHAVEGARSQVQCMEHDLTVTLPSEPIHLNADPTRLAQVVGNLLNNACKFTDKGGHIWLTGEREGEQAVIRVRDDGIGIAAEQLPRIFDMFVQVDTSLERSTSGLGIGLTLVKNLVEMHDGTVEAQSAGIGHGCEFVVRLPISAETPKPLREPNIGEPTPTKARRILVVDDNQDSATTLAMLLTLSGNETHTAHDGIEAVEAAARIKPDVVLLDIGLPKLNGYEACRRIRKLPGGNSIVLVALTGWGQEEDRKKSADAGFNHHMVKPMDLDALMKLLAENPQVEETP